MTEDEWRTSRDGQQMLVFVRTAEVPVRTRWADGSGRLLSPKRERGG